MKILDNLSLATLDGFEGGLPICDLLENVSQIPDIRGVYVVGTRDRSHLNPKDVSTAHKYKGRNPSVNRRDLQKLLDDSSSEILYIGKAGGAPYKTTLRKRIGDYLAFGVGKSRPHWGGRYIWQLEEASQLLVFWRKEPVQEPRTVEKQLIQSHKDKFGCRPFANLPG